MGINLLDPQVIQTVKTLAIVVSLLHFMAGMIMAFQVFRMNQIIKLANVGIFNLIVTLYLFLLGVILLLVVIF